MTPRKRTSLKIIGYGLHLYFLGFIKKRCQSVIFLKNNKDKPCFCLEMGSKVQTLESSLENKKIKEYVIYETVIKSGSKLIWLWIIIEPTNKEILATGISKKRNISIAKRFLFYVVNKYGWHSVSSDGGGTWYPQACRNLKFKYRLYSFYKKSIIERIMQYIKDRTEGFDDYFSCRKKKCKLKYMQK